MKKLDEDQAELDLPQEPLSYSLIQGMGEMVNFSHVDKMDISSKPAEFIQYFKNQYFEDT